MTSLQPYMDWEANGPSYLTDIEVDEESPSTDGEIWHVAISWDDIKMMTLDQLDDAFRLDVIAADTPVWKEGMSGWQPLSVVAGMEEQEEEEEATVMRPFPVPVGKRPAAPSRAPAPPPRPSATSRAPAPPPRPPASRASVAPPSRASVAPSRAPASAFPRTTMPVAQVAAPSAPFSQPPRAPAAPFSQPPRTPSAPPPQSLRAASPRSVAPLHAVPPVHVKTQPRMAPVKATLPFGSPSSLPPAADLAFARSAPPPSYRRPLARRTGSGHLWFFAPLALVGGLFAAYRNDLLLDAARSLHQEERYLAAERAVLGVPGFGTPRSVAAPSLNTDAPTDDHAADSLKVDRSALDPAPSTDTAPPVTEAAAKPKLDELPAVTPPTKLVETKPSPEPARAIETHKATPPEKAITRAAPPPVRAAPVARSIPASRPAPSSIKHDEGGVKAAKVVLAETDEDSAPARRPSASRKSSGAATKAAASFGTVGREEPKPVAEAPKPPPKPAAPPKPVAAPPPPPVVSSGNSSLDDAIRNAVNKKSAPAKKKGPNADYDPLNSDI